MNWEDIARELAFTTDSKIVLLVCDGLGGLPVGGRTELEAAKKHTWTRSPASACAA
jgi:2,3-bisphosphoglycerate-independent phosphoglycerate mutase